MGMMDIRRSLLQNKSDIPPIYKRVKYLVSVAQGAHIDTGVAGSPDLQIECEFLAETQYNYAGIFGNYVNSSTKGWRTILGANSTRLYYNANSTSSAELIPPSGSTIGSKIKVKINVTTGEITDASGTNSATSKAQQGTDNRRNIALGRYAVNKNVSGITQTYRIRIYGCKIWNNNVLIRNYIPCVRVSDNKAGFYDLVNYTFSPSISQYDFVVDTTV